MRHQFIKYIKIILFLAPMIPGMNSESYSQELPLEKLFISEPSVEEYQNIIKDFNIVLLDGTKKNAKWNLYSPFLFNLYDKKNPTIFPVINALRVIREQKFSKPLPFAAGDLYEYMRSHYSKGKIELALDESLPYANRKTKTMHLPATFAFWTLRNRSDPFTPLSDIEIKPFYENVLLFIHETRHLDEDDPGHSNANGGKSFKFSDDGSFTRECIYLMWLYKYGLNYDAKLKQRLEWKIVSYLQYRFIRQPPTHPNQDIQDIITLLYTPPSGERKVKPNKFRIRANYPNPFNPSTTLIVDIPEHTRLTIEIFNILGNRVKTLLNDEITSAGTKPFEWNAQNDSGQQVSSGMYILRATTSSGKFATQKILFIK